MGSFKIKTALTGLVSVIAATSLFAVDAVVDNNTDGTNANEFEAYWYYYDDNAGVKEDDRPQKAPDTKASVINVPFVEKDRAAFTGDKVKVKDYTFRVGTEGTEKFAQMPFTYGESWKATGYTATPYVGIGTMLAPDKKNIDLTGAKEVKFKLRAHANELTVVFKIETQDISDDSTFAFYCKTLTVPKGSWTTFTVPIATTEDDPEGLAQPEWYTEADPFTITQVTKIAWECPGGSNDITGDTLDVDDIIITNYEFVSPSVAPNGAVTAQPSGVFSTFETTAKTQTPLKTYWYAYNDATIGGNSSVSDGATTNDTTKLLNLKFVPGSGHDGVGTAPYLNFTLGKTIRQKSATGTDSVDVQGFVGMGFNCYDSATSTYFNAGTGKRGEIGPGGSTNSIYFDYLADGDFKYLTLEISDFHDVGDATTPTRKDSRGSGVVWYRNFLKTGPSTWKSVSIKFADLITHSDWKGYVDIPLDLTRLAKVQFKVQGAQGQAGTIMVDNVTFPGLTTPGSGVARSISRHAFASAFNASYLNGAISISWKNAPSVNGKINVLNTKGAVVASAPVAASKISAAALPAGMYFVELSGSDLSGKAVSQKTALTIVK